MKRIVMLIISLTFMLCLCYVQRKYNLYKHRKRRKAVD